MLFFLSPSHNVRDDKLLNVGLIAVLIYCAKIAIYLRLAKYNKSKQFLLLSFLYFGFEPSCGLSALAAGARACDATSGARHHLDQFARAFACLCKAFEHCNILFVKVGNHHALKAFVANMVLDSSEHACCFCEVVCIAAGAFGRYVWHRPRGM